MSRSAFRSERGESSVEISLILQDLEAHVISLQEQGVSEVECFGEFTADASPERIVHSVVAGGDSSQALPVGCLPRPFESAETASTGNPMDAIAREIEECRRCRLHSARFRVVPGQGAARPDILFVGEGPGREEDEQGIAFIGAAGRLLTSIIAAMGYDRKEVFITNVVKCRPPENRKPLPDEMDACMPFLRRQIVLLSPRIIVTLGATALEGLMGPPVSITRQRGKWLEFDGIPLMPTFHPSYLLRNQAAKAPVWADMQDVLRKLGRKPPERQRKSGRSGD